MTSKDLLLGVDGGGSKTAVRLARVAAVGGLQELGKGFAGPSNVRAVGPEHAFTNLDVAIDAAFADAGMARTEVAVAVLALAGSSSQDISAAIARWAQEHALARSVDIVHDAEPVLAVAANDAGGIALIVGTGSVALGRDEHGRRSVAGGWGHWFGDAGSGHDIGRRALRAIAAAEDGTGPATALRDVLLARLRIEQPRDIVRCLGSAFDAQREIAALAEPVLALAGEGDAVAGELVAAAAADSAALVRSVAARLGFAVPVPLGLAGGVACGSELFRRQLLQLLEVGPVVIVDEPVAGSLRLAQARLQRGGCSG